MSVLSALCCFSSCPVSSPIFWSLLCIYLGQVDIFYLGTCLYELMSLRPLPPADISEAEYRNMLKMGKRASFSTKVIH